MRCVIITSQTRWQQNLVSTFAIALLVYLPALFSRFCLSASGGASGDLLPLCKQHLAMKPPNPPPPFSPPLDTKSNTACGPGLSHMCLRQIRPASGQRAKHPC